MQSGGDTRVPGPLASAGGPRVGRMGEPQTPIRSSQARIKKTEGGGGGQQSTPASLACHHLTGSPPPAPTDGKSGDGRLRRPGSWGRTTGDSFGAARGSEGPPVYCE